MVVLADASFFAIVNVSSVSEFAETFPEILMFISALIGVKPVYLIDHWMPVQNRSC